MSFVNDDDSGQPPRSNITAKIAGVLCFVAAFLAMKYITSGSFFGPRHGWTPAQIDSELLANADAGPLYSAIKANFPDDYQRFTVRLAEAARTGGDAAIERDAFAFSHQLMVDHFDDLARAPSAEIQTIARQYVVLYGALRRTDVGLCAQLATTGFRPGIRPAPEVRSILAHIGVMQVAAAHSGETQPRDARGPVNEQEAGQFVRAVQARSRTAGALISNPQAFNAATPDVQCATGAAIYEATAALPPDVAANVMIDLLRETFGQRRPGSDSLPAR